MLGGHGSFTSDSTYEYGEWMLRSNRQIYRIYDADPSPVSEPQPGKLPPDIDPQLRIPDDLPRTTQPSPQERWDKTPIYDELT